MKGTEYAVFKDFSIDTRLTRKKLFNLKSEIKKISPATAAFVSVDKLIVAGKAFTIEDGKLIGHSVDGLKELF